MEPLVQHAPFVHHGRTGAMIRLALKNLLLSIVTFTLWRFWGKTRVRRQLWADTEFWGDAAEYTGTGKELFLGFIVALVAVFMPIVVAMGAAQAAVAAGHAWAGLLVLLLQILIMVLAMAGVYRARRYQMTRTVWRGIRGGQTGSALRYGLMVLGVGLITVLTLGWALPWGEMGLARYRMENTTFGDCAFECDARAKGLYKRFAVVWLAGVVFFVGIGGGFAAVLDQVDDPEKVFLVVLAGYALAVPWAVLTLGLPLAWYRAAYLRQLAAHTRFDGVAFSLEATTGGLVKLALGNLLISLLSLGILRPWAALRTFRFGCAHLRMAGEPDWGRVHQSAAARLRTGEGLAAVFDGAGEF